MIPAPKFWYKPTAGLMARLLAPLSAIWTIGTRRRIARGPGQGVGCPVICVGNLTVGGTGKTPTAIALISALASHGVAPQIVSRGYGGRLKGPVRVDERRHKAEDVGDEPLLLSAFAPVWVAADRVAAAKAAAADGAGVIIMDDGFQNPTLAKDLSLIVVDAETGFGNGRVMPAGPLREPVADGLARGDAVVLVGPAAARTAFRARHDIALPVLDACLEPLETGMDWAGLRAYAFAGIGRPQKVFDTLRGLGVELVETRAFGDHEPYRRDLVQRMLNDAARQGARLVTTEKDAVRLPADLRREVLTLPVRLSFADQAALDDVLAPVVMQA